MHLTDLTMELFKQHPDTLFSARDTDDLTTLHCLARKPKESLCKSRLNYFTIYSFLNIIETIRNSVQYNINF